MSDATSQRAAPFLDDGDVQLYHGDVITTLQSLPAGMVQTVVTSPPYWGLRDYGTGEWDGGDTDCQHLAPPKGGAQAGSALSTLGPKRDGLGPDNSAWVESRGAQFRDVCGRCGARRVDQQLGLEATPTQYVERIVAVFREVWRVLRPDATVWLNLGDSYLPDKQLAGMPWRVAFALQEAGWFLRSDIVWAKCIPNPMPESVSDRPTKAHEYLFLLTKQPRYFYDADAIREPVDHPELLDQKRNMGVIGTANGMARGGGQGGHYSNPAGRNRRSVWTIPTEPFPEAHFATYPQELVRPCILAGSRQGDTVLDPFVGSGTTALVARKHGRRCIGIDLSAEYLAIAARRLQQLSLFAEPA